MSKALSRARVSPRRRGAVLLDGAICLAIFLGTWLSRAAAASAFVTWDEPAWVYRSVRFLQALGSGNLRGTLVVGHPGVLTMWSGALSLAWNRFVTGAISQAQLDATLALPGFEVHDAAAIRALAALLPHAKGGIIALHAVFAVVFFLLLRRLLDRRYALVAALILASDPYYLAMSRVLHMDALVSGAMLISLLAALVYARGGGRGYLVVSGIAVGLGVLTKTYAVLVAPADCLILVAAHAPHPLPSLPRAAHVGERVGGEGCDPSASSSAAAHRSLPGDVALWAAAAAGAFVALWPAMWVAPLAAARAMLGLSLQYATSPGDATAAFFRGQAGGDPGAAFYLLAMLFRTTPLVVAGVLLAIVGLFVTGRGGEAGQARRSVTATLLGYLVLYLAIITLSKKKYDRYMLPVLLGTDVLAAVGWVGVLELATGALGRLVRAWSHRRGEASEAQTSPQQAATPGLAPAAIAAFLVLAQAGLLLGPLYPAHYLAYYNPLVGGAGRAMTTIPVGWGEGIERAAAYLAAKPNAAKLSVATWAVAGVAPLFPGEVNRLSPEAVAEADYVLLYAADLQSGEPLASAFHGVQQPELTVTLNGIPYAWLYPNVYYQELAATIEREAAPGDVVVSNLHSSFERHYQGSLPWRVIEGSSEEAVAAQLEAGAGQAQQIFYLEFPGQGSTPRDYIRRQLAQGALLLWQEPFAYGTLSCYRRVAAARFAPIRTDQRDGVVLGGQLRLEAHGFANTHVQYRQEVGLALDWQALERPDEDYHFTLRLVDDQGRWWGQRDGPLEDASGRRTAGWAPGTPHLMAETMPLAPGVPPGRYWVVLALYRLEDLSRLPVTAAGGQAQGNEYRLGAIYVDSATVQPEVADLSIPNPTDIKLGSWAEILGYALDGEPLASGDEAALTLFWRCLGPTPVPYELVLRLAHEGKTVATLRLPPTGVGHPSDRWVRGEIIRYTQSLPVPADAASGSYGLYLNLVEAGKPASEQGQLLTRVRLVHQEHLFELPPIQHPLSAALGSEAELLGYDLEEETAAPGGTLHLTLYWRAGGPTAVPYTVFTHLLDGSGALRGQHDGAPANGERSTTGWVAGEIIVDPHEIPVQAGSAPGAYRLEIGLYEAASGRRLGVLRGGEPTGEDRVLLPAVVVVRAP